jgi:ribonucleoside-diphosphate reductase beta chain
MGKDTTAVAGDEEFELTRLTSARGLYRRWETQHWSASALNLDEDVVNWRSMRPFMKSELLNVLLELDAGEVCVTETLSPLLDHAQNLHDRLYLCTQIVDEARHVHFFRRYLDAIGEGSAIEDCDGESAYSRYFEPALVRATSAVRSHNGDAAVWYRALVFYHLATEGILAATILRTLRAAVRHMRIGLPALAEGLTNVARDETRHITFGLGALRNGVREGYGAQIAAAYLESVGRAAWVAVGPDHCRRVPALGSAIEQRGRQFEEQWSIARGQIRRHLSLIGLEEICGESEEAWDAECGSALDYYAKLWGEEHPVRQMAARVEGR